MREKNDEITQLKTREVSLIEKAETLEKGQIINMISIPCDKHLILWSSELVFLKDETQAYKNVSITARRSNLIMF